jgi:hypothetical protein
MNKQLKRQIYDFLSNIDQKDNSPHENLVINEIMHTLRHDPAMDEIQTIRQLCSHVHEQLNNTLFDIFPEIELNLEDNTNS